MPYATSAQMSGLIGGQQAMFSNMVAHSQQIAGLYGTGPMTGAGAGMQNPFPSSPPPNAYGTAGGQDIGARVAGGLGMAIPGALTGASIAGGLMGGAAGYADPFTGVARAFRAGTGAAAGAGIRGTLGRIGAAFTTGGMRAGLGVLGGGVAAGAAMALPYMAIGGAAQKLGETIYAGARDVSEVGQIAGGIMGPQGGAPGARPGGGLGRGQIKSIIGMMSEIASDEVMASMDDLKRLMDRAGQMGMLTGAGGLTGFKQKFKQIVESTKQVANILGTTLDEALPMVNQMNQMGLWKTTDIMGGAIAARTVGPQATGAMMSTMQQGAQRAHALGGGLAAGAQVGQESFLNVRAMMRGGTMSEQQLREFTGGVGGIRGQQMMASQMGGVIQQFGQSSAGRLMMAGLGQTREGRFTGGIDPEKMQQFLRGDISVGELQQMGRKATTTRAGAVSFTRRQGAIGQELGAKGGIEGVASMIQQVMQKGGFAGEDEQNILMQKMTGMTQRQADFMQDLIKDLPRIREQKQNDFEQAVSSAFREANERSSRSWGGIKASIGQAWDNFWAPAREFGTDLATSFGEASDRMADQLMGRVRDIPVTNRERMQRLRQGAMTRGGTMGDLGITGIGQAAMGTSFAESMRLGTGGRTGFAALGGAAAAAMGLGFTRGDVLEGAGMEAGGGRAAQEFTTRRMFMRATSPTASGLGLGGKKAEQQKNLGAVKSSLRRLMTDSRTANKLRDMKNDDPVAYQRELAKMLRGDPEAAKAKDA